MLGIKNIASYVPDRRESNLIPRKIEAFGTNEEFVLKKIGVRERSVMGGDEETSVLAWKALEQLMKTSALSPSEIEVLIVVTQNPDSNLPHISAMVHGLAGLDAHCAAFDVGLGCSGYVYGLSIVSSFMAANGLTTGVLITADPYSKIVDPEDKNTALLFGDASTATLIGQNPIFMMGPFSFGTYGKYHRSIECIGGKLFMNGRVVFNFAATKVPVEINTLLKRCGFDVEDIDAFLFHQGSRYIVETIASRLNIPRSKVRFGLQEIGNTVSSSIPLLLEKELHAEETNKLILSGFGVGLSYSSCLCSRETLKLQA
jgi:3-oxoacyl-[acyl-carrier-protein] synthase-3